jgi:hypothetical protein
MFIHKIPLFNPAPLHREILESMRDLTLLEQTARFADYSSGILVGCGLIERDMNIGVSTGLVKFGGKVYVLESGASVKYEPTDEWIVLKARFGAEEKSRDFVCSTGELVLDSNVELLPNEIEFGRFKLKRGFRLRTEYVDFADMMTEYDTVNLINATFAGIGEPTLSPAILENFAKEAFEYAENPIDTAFCCFALGNSGVVSRECIRRYILKRLKAETESNSEIFHGLEQILLELKGQGGGIPNSDDEGVLLY